VIISLLIAVPLGATVAVAGGSTVTAKMTDEEQSS
jgi:hypothetical protein